MNVQTDAMELSPEGVPVLKTTPLAEKAPELAEKLLETFPIDPALAETPPEPAKQPSGSTPLQGSSTRLSSDLEALSKLNTSLERIAVIRAAAQGVVDRQLAILRKDQPVGKIVCGTKEHPLFPDDVLELNPKALGLSMLGVDDLYRKGFKQSTIAANGLSITIHGVTIKVRENHA